MSATWRESEVPKRFKSSYVFDFYMKPSTSLLQQLLLDLKHTWDYIPEELDDIEEKMKVFACAACIDSEVRKEAFESKAKYKLGSFYEN